MFRNVMCRMRFMIAVIALAIVASCGGGGSGSPAATSGSLSVSPATLSFSGFIDATTAPGPQTLTISDTASSNYAWSGSILYQSGSGWLQLNGNAIAAGQTVPAQQVTVTVDRSSLPIGVHSSSIVIQGNGKTVTIPVAFTLSAPITFSPSGVTHNYSPGSTTIASVQLTLALLDPQGTPASGGTVTVSNANNSQIILGTDPNATPLSLPALLTADANGIVVVTVNYSLGPVAGEHIVLEAWRNTTYKPFSVTLVCADPDPNLPPACP